VVHRDVKPGNLLVGPNAVTKLGDFGMALGPPDARIGNARLRVGTPYYTAPEVWRGEPAGPAADIYSLGATYFHLLTGRPPFPGADVPAVEEAHLHGPVPDPRALRPQLPAACAALVMRALAKIPGDRQASAQELVWEGRRLLQELQQASGPPARAAGNSSAAEPSAPVSDRRSRPDRRAAAPRPAGSGPAPSALLSEAFGFVRRPFAEADPQAPPYLGEPFGSVRQAVTAALLSQRVPALAVTGPAGAGRSTLCRGVAAAMGRERLVLVLDLERGAAGPSLLQRLCRAAGAEEASAHGSLEALVERLAEERQRGNCPLLLLDGVSPGPPPTGELAALLGAARATGAFQVLLAGAPGIAQALGGGAGEPLPEVAIPPLRGAQLADYLRAWLKASRAPAAPPVLVSPDALLLLGLRSEGLPGRVDCLAENMLLLAASGHERALSSWHAWAASDQERWAARRVPLPRRPATWPPAEVVAVLDACRRGAGLPPWPRGSP
jgi:type II secretory pathway predicted ATPase ExeA